MIVSVFARLPNTAPLGPDIAFSGVSKARCGPQWDSCGSSHGAGVSEVAMFDQPQQQAPDASTRVFGRLAPIAQIDFAAVAAVIRRQARFIALVTAGALLAMAAFVLLVTSQYTATTEILINPTELQAVDKSLTSNVQLSDANIVQVESQVRVLTSDSVLRRVVASQQLDIDPEFAGVRSGFRDVLRAVLDTLGVSLATNNTDHALEALNELRRRVGVRRAERTYVVDVSVVTREAEKSVRIANAIAKAYLAEQAAASSEAARRVSDSISGRLNELKTRVREAEERVEQFKARNNMLDSQGQPVNERQLTELNTLLVQARARTAEAQSRYELVRGLQQNGTDVGAVPEAIQSQTVTALRSQYAVALQQESEQRAKLGDRHPSLYEIHQQVETLRRLIRDEIARVAVALRNDYERAKSNEESLDRSLDALKRTAVSAREQLVPLRELEREVQTSRAVYESFLTRARETGEQERIDTKNIRVISPADVPMRRSWPPRNALLFLGALFCGLGAGTGLAFLRDARSAARRHDAALPAPAAAAPSDELPLLAVLPPHKRARALEVLGQPQSRFASEIRALEKVLRQTSPRRLLILGVKDDDAAAAVALNLAAVAATARRVLVVDADPSRRALARLLLFAPAGGLIDARTDQGSVKTVIKRDERSRIDIVPLSARSRRDAPQPEEVKAAFDAATGYDLTIVAASGRNGALPALAGAVDKIALVLDAGGVQGDDAGVLALLDGSEDKLAGIVVANAGARAQPTAA